MWSVSFYPQVEQNWRRRSVVGLSLDFQLLNLVGFLCYFIFNAALLYSPGMKQEYGDAHSGHVSVVKLNDVLFAGHAVVLTLVTLIQIYVFYDYPPLLDVERLLRAFVLGAIAFVLVGAGSLALAVVLLSETWIDWLTYITLLSYVKVVISIWKYCPQVWMNYQRKSTDGWSISNVLLDFSGGLLSVMQLCLDAALADDWSAVVGNPAKLLLGNLSM